jgi:O-antigen/teichoic acid export membrane protein
VGPIAAAGIGANVGSLVVTVALARLFAARDYGALNQLIGVFVVVSTPGSAILVAVVRRAASWDAGRDGPIGGWVARIHRRGAVALCVFAGLVALAGPPLAGLLGRGDPLGIDAAAVAGGVFVLLSVDRGLLQAHRRYRAVAGNLLVEGVLRTALMMAAGAAALGAPGVAVAILVAEAGTALHARSRVRTLGAPVPPGTAWRAWRESRRATAAPRPAGSARGGAGPKGVAVPDVTTAAVALGAVALLQYADVLVLVREAPRHAGAYAAVSVATKALVFLALAVAGYLLPEAAISSRGGGHALRQLSVTLGALALPASVLVAVSVWAAKPLLRVVFSGRYVAAAGAFAPLALAMVCLSGVVLLTAYLLAVGDRMVGLLLVLGAAAGVVAVACAGGRPRETALADLAVQAALFALCLLELARVHRRVRAGVVAAGTAAAGSRAGTGGPGD